MASILILLKNITFCETCPLGKQHRTKFPLSSTRANEPLDLVHSDLCGKMNVKSESGAEYLSFIDDKRRCVGLYFTSQRSSL